MSKHTTITTTWAITLAITCALAALAIGVAIGSMIHPSPAAPTPEDAGNPHAGHGHGGDERAHQVTIWDDRFEVFCEYPYPVVNEPATFVIHFSTLATGEARSAGPLIVAARHDSEKTFEHREAKPAREGIYLPEITFPLEGTWTLTLVVPVDGTDHRIEVPPVTVYHCEDDADAASDPEEVTGISFLKEQQWLLKVTTEPTTRRDIGGRSVLVVPASVLAHVDEDPEVFVQIAGETFEARSVELGARYGDFVEVTAGLAEGDRYVTSGMEAIHDAEHDDAVSHAQGDDAVGVTLSEAAMERHGIQLGAVGPGRVTVSANVQGELTLNQNKVAHIVPRAPGVVRRVLTELGDTVKEGDIVAWIESADLGKQKLDYLAKWSDKAAELVDLNRAREVFDSTLKLLEVLDATPTLEAVQSVGGDAMGKNRSLLVSAYAEFIFTGEKYRREKELFEKKVSSKDDFLKAESEFKKAGAHYAATRDSAAFAVRRTLLDAQRAYQVSEIALKGAERRLYVLGLANDGIKELESLALRHLCAAGNVHVERDRRCEDCEKNPVDEADLRRIEEMIAWYPLRAPFDGTITAKHIALGEVVTTESQVLVLADLTAVWLDLRVHKQDLPRVRKGQTVTVSAPGLPRATGAISYLGGLLEESTRTVLARVVLPNPLGVLRPGLFVTAQVAVETVDADLVVPRESIQELDDRSCVFVREGERFVPHPVTIGRSDSILTEIVDGLEAGQKVATQNSFRLKAEVGKLTMGGGGHGHAH